MHEHTRTLTNTHTQRQREEGATCAQAGGGGARRHLAVGGARPWQRQRVARLPGAHGLPPGEEVVLAPLDGEIWLRAKESGRDERARQKQHQSSDKRESSPGDVRVNRAATGERAAHDTHTRQQSSLAARPSAAMANGWRAPAPAPAPVPLSLSSCFSSCLPISAAAAAHQVFGGVFAREHDLELAAALVLALQLLQQLNLLRDGRSGTEHERNSKRHSTEE